MTPYHDGIYEAARRNYTPSGRSFHIPPDEFKRPSFVIIVLACVLAAVSLVGLVMR